VLKQSNQPSRPLLSSSSVRQPDASPLLPRLGVDAGCWCQPRYSQSASAASLRLAGELQVAVGVVTIADGRLAGDFRQ